MRSLTFHIEHGDWNADIQLLAAHSLHDLAEGIIKSVGFDLDHCFGFYDNLKDYYHSKEEYTLFADIGEESKKEDTGEADEIERAAREDELRRNQKKLDRANLVAQREARRNPPPPTVRAYQEVYGTFPAGWPPDPYLLE